MKNPVRRWTLRIANVEQAIGSSIALSAAVSWVALAVAGLWKPLALVGIASLAAFILKAEYRKES